MKPYSFTLTPAQADTLCERLQTGNFLPFCVPYARIAVDAPSYPCKVVLYTSRKLVIQGKGCADFIRFVLEPEILKTVVLDQNEENGVLLPPPLSAEACSDHIGVDESGKGDFFGPLVIAAVHVDATIAPALQKAGAKDSKQISSDTEARKTAASLREILTERNYAVLCMHPRYYNRLYERAKSINRILAWAHAECITKVLEKNPLCPMAISDQFGREDSVRRELRKKGRNIELRSRTKAEADIAVAAASILARDFFLQIMENLSKKAGIKLPKGATFVREAGLELVRKHGASALPDYVKVHFKTTQQILAAAQKTNR